MRKFTLIKASAALVVALSAPSAFAQSGSSGSSGTSGRAGLGIDYAALVAAGATGNPGVAMPGSSARGTLGGPIAGLRSHFGERKRQ